MLWPQMRSSIANYLVQNQVLAKEEAYRQVFDAIPDSGNCWCFSDKHDTSKGAPQDLYDTACRKFHYCMKCGYKSDLADYDENAVLSIDTSAPTAIFQVTNNLTDVVENNDVINYNSDNNSISIYEWQCDPNQPESALACCKCYTMLEEDSLNVFLSEMDSGTTNSTCSKKRWGRLRGWLSDFRSRNNSSNWRFWRSHSLGCARFLLRRESNLAGLQRVQKKCDKYENLICFDRFRKIRFIPDTTFRTLRTTAPINLAVVWKSTKLPFTSVATFQLVLLQR